MGLYVTVVSMPATRSREEGWARLGMGVMLRRATDEQIQPCGPGNSPEVHLEASKMNLRLAHMPRLRGRSRGVADWATCHPS